MLSVNQFDCMFSIFVIYNVALKKDPSDPASKEQESLLTNGKVETGKVQLASNHIRSSV